MTKTLTSAIAATALVALAGCHTVNGAGKDMRSAGDAVSKASGETGKKSDKK